MKKTTQYLLYGLMLGLFGKFAYDTVTGPKPEERMPHIEVNVSKVPSSSLLEEIARDTLQSRASTKWYEDEVPIIERYVKKIELSNAIQDRAYNLNIHPGNETKERLNRLYNNAKKAYDIVSKIRMDHFSRMIRDGDTLTVKRYDDGKLFEHYVVFKRGGSMDDDSYRVRDREVIVITKMKDNNGKVYHLVDFKEWIKEDYTLGELIGDAEKMFRK